MMKLKLIVVSFYLFTCCAINANFFKKFGEAIEETGKSIGDATRQIEEEIGKTLDPESTPERPSRPATDSGANGSTPTENQNSLPANPSAAEAPPVQVLSPSATQPDFNEVWEAETYRFENQPIDKERVFFSPDGETVAYVARKGSRVAMCFNDQLGPTFDEILTKPVFSDDSKMHAYVGRKRDNLHVVINNHDVGPPFVRFDHKEIKISQTAGLVAYAVVVKQGEDPVLYINHKKVGQYYDFPSFSVSNNGENFTYLGFVNSDGTRWLNLNGKTKELPKKEGIYHQSAFLDAGFFPASNQHYAIIRDQKSRTEVQTYMMTGGQKWDNIESVDGIWESEDWILIQSGRNLFLNGELIETGIERDSAVVRPKEKKWAALKKYKNGYTVVSNFHEESFEYGEIRDLQITPSGKRFAYTCSNNGPKFFVVDGEEYGPFTRYAETTIEFSKNEESWIASVINGVQLGGPNLFFFNGEKFQRESILESCVSDDGLYFATLSNSRREKKPLLSNKENYLAEEHTFVERGRPPGENSAFIDPGNTLVYVSNIGEPGYNTINFDGKVARFQGWIPYSMPLEEPEFHQPEGTASLIKLFSQRGGWAAVSALTNPDQRTGSPFFYGDNRRSFSTKFDTTHDADIDSAALFINWDFHKFAYQMILPVNWKDIVDEYHYVTYMAKFTKDGDWHLVTRRLKE